MAMTEADEWLQENDDGAPDALRERMRNALAGTVEARVPDALADAALAQLATVLNAPSPRSAAIGLLAADALLTAAFEAAADAPDTIQQLAQRYDPARLAALLES
jgi:hypothetical protein